MVWADSSDSENWVMVEKDSRLLPAGEWPLATLEHPDLVKIERHQNNKIKIIALKEGHTRIKFHGGEKPAFSLTISITSKKLHRQYQEIKHRLQGIHGLKLSIARNEVVLEGRLLLPNDVKKIKKIKLEYPDILNLTRFDRPFYQKVTAKYLQNKLEAPTITVRIKDQFLILEGKVANKEEAKKLETKAMTLASISDSDLTLKSLIEVKKTMINVELTFMQINRKEAKKAGFNILETFKAIGSLTWSGPGTPGGGLTTGADAKINALLENSWADVITQPKIYVNSGEENFFQDGDDFYLKGNDNNKTIKVRTGLIIKVAPLLHSNGEVDLKISFEVSAPNNSAQGDLGVTSFKTETTVTCPLGQTIILSELTTSIKRTFKNRTPLLGSIPILSLFFSSETKSKAQKDLVLFITPKVPSFKADLVKAEYRFQTLRELLRD
jgi:Flp pilus assembly secretin CpaC